MNEIVRRHLRTHAIACLVLFALAGCASATRQSPSSTSISIFDGKTLNGWIQRGGKATYSVEDACIVGRTAPNQPNSFLCTTHTYRDLELVLEFKIDPQLNSGIQIRSEARPEEHGDRVFGYQVEIDPSPRAWTGGLYDEGRRGWLVDLKDKPDSRAAFREGEWNHLRIRAVGPRIQTWLNGVPVVDALDSMTPEGFIALQVHGVGSRAEPLEVRWRSIRLAKIGRP